jgi:hypothetical protein
MTSNVSLSNPENDLTSYFTIGRKDSLHFAVASHQQLQHIHGVHPVCLERDDKESDERLRLTAQWLQYLIHFGSVGNVSAIIATT